MKKSLLAYKPLANNETEDESNESDEFEDEPKPIPKNRRKKIAVASEKSTKEEIAPKKRSNPATTPKNVKRVKKDINID